MRARFLFAPTLAIATVLVTGSAEATTLRTPYVELTPDQKVRIEVTNTGKKNIDGAPVVTLRGRNGQIVTPANDFCVEDAPLEPGASCSVFYNAGLGGFCTVESGGKIRATMNIYALPSAAVVTVVPATK